MTCVHDIYNESSTLKELPYQLLSYPPRVFYECSVCREILEYKLNEENGRYEIVERGEENGG